MEPAGDITTSGSGWDIKLIKECEQNLDFVKSTDGLAKSEAFAAFLLKRNIDASSAAAKLNTLKDLRKSDPESFMQLWSRKDIKEYDSVEASRLAMILDYVLTIATWCGVMVWYMSSDHLPLAYQVAPFAIWLLLQLSAWSSGFASPYARALGVYLCSGEDVLDSPVASMPWIAAAQLLELVYVLLTCLFGALISIGFQAGLDARGQTVSQKALGLYGVRESSKSVKLEPCTSETEGDAAVNGECSGAQMATALFDEAGPSYLQESTPYSTPTPFQRSFGTIRLGLGASASKWTRSKHDRSQPPSPPTPPY